MKQILLIIGAVFALYLPFVGHEYITIDDPSLITSNPTVTQFDIPRAFTTYDPELYIPLTLFTYQVEHLLFGFTPIVSHGMNIALHALSATLVFLIITRLTRNTLIGLCTALLFAVHPMQSTTVLWASARKDLLSSALMLLALHFYLRGNKWSIGTYAAALLAKVSVAVFPIALIAVDVWEGKEITKESIKEKWPYFGLSIVLGIVALLGKAGNVSSLSVTDTILLSVKNIVFSLQKLVLPTGLSFSYFQTTTIGFSPEFLVPIAVLLLIGVGLYVVRNSQSIVLWCSAWFALFMAPNLFTYFQNGNVVFASNRYVYLASIGVFLCVSTLAMRLKKVGIVALGCITVALAIVTGYEARAWRSSASLLTHALAAGYDIPMVHHNLGAAYASDGDSKQALLSYMRAAEQGYPYAFKLAGDLEAAQGNNEKALELYQGGMEAARQRGVYGTVDLASHFKIGEILLSQGRTADAMRVFEEALSLGPTIASAHSNLGTLALKQGKIANAKMYLEDAVKIDRFSAGAWYHLGYIYAQEGKFTEAQHALERVLRIDPDYEGAKANLDQLRQSR